jgi:hypothetical protein
VEPKSKSNGRWFWIALFAALGFIIVIAIQQTAARRNAVRQRAAEQPPLVAGPKEQDR